MNRPDRAIWCEFTPYDQLHDCLPDLAAAGLSLHLHVRPDDVGTDPLARLLQAAHDRGVVVKAWLLLEDGELIYCSRHSLHEYGNHARAFADWARVAGLPLQWLAFDCEPPTWFGRALFEHLSRREYGKLWRFAREQEDPAAFERAAADLSGLVGGLQRDGFKVLGATIRPVLEGLHHRSLLVQDVLGVPFSMVPWDRVSFLVYRYQLTQAKYEAWVHRYACVCRKLFGERGGLDVGMIGGQSMLEGHLNRWEEFEEVLHRYLKHIEHPKDVRAALAQAEHCGLGHVHLYSLDGALASNTQLADWLRATETIQPHASRWEFVRTELTGRILYWIFRIALGGEGRLRAHMPLLAEEFRAQAAS